MGWRSLPLLPEELKDREITPYHRKDAPSIFYRMLPSANPRGSHQLSRVVPRSIRKSQAEVKFKTSDRFLGVSSNYNSEVYYGSFEIVEMKEHIEDVLTVENCFSIPWSGRLQTGGGLQSTGKIFGRDPGGSSHCLWRDSSYWMRHMR